MDGRLRSGAPRGAAYLLAAVTLFGAAAAVAQPADPAQPPPRGMQGLPPGHPPVPMPGDRPAPRPRPERPRPQPRVVPPGQPPRAQPGTAPVTPLTLDPHKQHAAAAEVCPGHGPLDAPHHINFWHGLIGVNNERALEGGVVNRLLWRYESRTDKCDERNEPPPLLANLINFGALAFILYTFGRKPLAAALQKRKSSIMQEIDNAARLKAEADARLRELEDKFESIEETLDSLKGDYAEQARVEQKNVLAEAEERRQRMRRDAEFRMEQELKAARVVLLHEAVQEATRAAQQLIAQKATQADQDRIAEEYLSSLGAGAIDRGPGRSAPGGGAARVTESA